MSNSPSPPRQSFRSRMGAAVRRASVLSTLSNSNLRRSESKSSLSDSGKDSKSSSLKVGTTLAPPANPGQTVISPVAESPAREIAASAPTPTGPSPLAGEATSQPENPPNPESAPPDPPSEPPFSTEVLTTEPEEMKVTPPETTTVDAEASPPSEPPAASTFEPPTVEAGFDSPDKAYGLHLSQPAVVSESDHTGHEETTAQVTIVPPAAEDPETSENDNHDTASLPHTPPHRTFANAEPVSSKRSTASLGRKSVAESVPMSEASTSPGEVSPKPSKSSLASSYGWSARADPNPSRYVYKNRSNGDIGAGSSARDSIDDPFVDPPPKQPDFSRVESNRIPEPEPYQIEQSLPEQALYIPAHVSMPLPPIHDVIASKSVRGVPSTYTMASRKVDIAVETDETRPLLSRLPVPQTAENAKGVEHALQTYHNDNPWVSSTGTPLQTLGWRHITLPDNTVYFVHSGMRITTDVDLRITKKLEAMTTYLQHSQPAENVLPPEGWELWLVDAGTTKNDFTPARSWVNHTEKILSFDSPPLLELENDSTCQTDAGSDDRLDLEYRYWAFMESHPAHVPLPPNARVDALDALTWSYTDCLLPSSRPIPPPFAQDECQELMKLLRSLGLPQDSDSQKVVHTRIVSRILMRLAQWRQHYFRPNKPLPVNIGKSGPRQSERRIPFRKTARDFLISTLCLGLPYLFLDRAHPFRIVDEEGGTRSAGPMLAIGACSCLVAAIILSASVTLITLPGLDNLGRIAGFVAILCSTASMISAVMALFRYKADVERTVVYIGGEGLVMLSRRSIVMSLPLVFLAWGIAAFITGITLYSFRGFTITPPGVVKQHFEDLTHWIVVGVMGVLAGVLITSALLLRR